MATMRGLRPGPATAVFLYGMNPEARENALEKRCLGPGQAARGAGARARGLKGPADDRA